MGSGLIIVGSRADWKRLMVLSFVMQGLLGEYNFKSKRTRNEVCQNGDCRCFVYLLAVTEVMDVWPEQDTRQREWVRDRAGDEVLGFLWRYCG